MLEIGTRATDGVLRANGNGTIEKGYAFFPNPRLRNQKHAFAQ